MKKKIAIIHYSSPPTIGGVEFIIQGHAQVLSAHGHRTQVIAGSGKSNNPGIAVRVIPRMRATDPEVAAVQNELGRGEVTTRFTSLTTRLVRDITNACAGFDICFIHNVLTMHFNLALSAALLEVAKNLPRITFYAWCHDATVFNPDYTLPKPDCYPWNTITRLHKGIRYIAISELRRKELSNLFGVRPGRIRVVPDGMDVVSFLGLTETTQRIIADGRLTKRDLVLFYPSRIVGRKNYELAIRIASELRKLDRDVALILTGAPDPHNPATAGYWQALKKQIRELGLQHNVLLLHELTKKYGRNVTIGYAELRNLYDISDLLLFTSTQEGFGLPLLEAAVKKLPVACSVIPPFREIAGKNALFFKLDDPPASIAARIDRFMQRRKTHRLFRKVLQTYSWEAVYEQHLKKLVK